MAKALCMSCSERGLPSIAHRAQYTHHGFEASGCLFPVTCSCGWEAQVTTGTSSCSCSQYEVQGIQRGTSQGILKAESGSNNVLAVGAGIKRLMQGGFLSGNTQSIPDKKCEYLVLLLEDMSVILWTGTRIQRQSKMFVG